MNLQQYQELIKQSIDDNQAIASKAEKQLDDVRIRTPQLYITLIMQNFKTNPFHETTASSFLQLKALSEKVVFDISKIGDSAFKKMVQDTLFETLQRRDINENDLSVLASVIPGVASKYLFRGEWNDYVPKLISAGRAAVNFGALVVLAGSISLRIIRFENYADDILFIMTRGFEKKEFQPHALGLLLALVNNVDKPDSLKQFAPKVSEVLKETPVSDLNLMLSRISEFVSKNKGFFSETKGQLIDAIDYVNSKPGVLARVKRMGNNIKDMLK
ncbi:hypothetical protein GPJ56_007268 [Histomonas meleagridis]|uniref:uncharacterized protein n=1 Tax=Histomonas meleagridis TaxID=135588 RepID=UPI003559808D|nr:hypothetical protein GPJ56_007268 [Histomonas meleagridis]KAH0804114.1 hypothetical protein GO595_002944 [Histomonas meleagridis]